MYEALDTSFTPAHFYVRHTHHQGDTLIRLAG